MTDDAVELEFTTCGSCGRRYIVGEAHPCRPDIMCGPCADGICDWMGCTFDGLGILDCSCDEQHSGE